MTETMGKIRFHVVKLGICFIACAVFTSIILVMSGAPPVSAYLYIIKGALGSWFKIAQVIQVWIPLTITSLGLLYTFRIDLWNIGVEGQVMIGAVFTTFVLKLDTGGAYPGLTLFTAVLAGILGGGLWAALAGYLKTKGGIHEIFAGLGLNFVAQGALLWLIFGPWKRPGIASMSGTEQFTEALWLPYIKSLRISPYALIMVTAAFVATYLFLNKFKVGLYLKAVGKNTKASNLYGLKSDKYFLIAMLIAGGFAGLAGFFQVTAVYHRLIPVISSNYGYLALLVVMLSQNRLLLTPFVSFFFAGLNVGSIQLPMMMQLDSSLSGVIQGILVLATLAVYSWKSRSTGKKS